MRLLVKLPVPAPLEVWLSLVVGLPVVFQLTPRAVIAAPPLLVIVPPLVAVVAEIEVTLDAVTVAVVVEGADAAVVKLVGAL